ncbi:MAG: rhodanese-like domain-containing protein [Verrucomicrobiota bacterium]|nr:rhodanese-like domain-containing protein [Verrucomicrobiota bacterium]
MTLRILGLAVVALFVLGAGALCAQGLGWSFVNWKVRHDFPGVHRIEPAELAAWLNDRERAQPVLLDVRTRAEFEVSHLHGARWIDPNASAASVELPKDEPIVTYCSVGYRSGAFAKKLQEAGFTQVENMSGSIFQWANEGRPVERDGRRVEKVHPYNKVWGKLLKPELRAAVRPAGATL